MRRFHGFTTARAWNCTLACLVVGTLLSSVEAAGVPKCTWVDELGFCTATVAGPPGDRFVAINAGAAACLANSDDSGTAGCTFETPVCRDVAFVESGLAMCLPLQAKFRSGQDFFNSFTRFENCVGRGSQDCTEVRTGMYEALGCPECAAIYERALRFAPDCYSASTAALCADADIVVRADSGTAANATAAVDFGMLGGFDFKEESLEDELVSVESMPGVITPEGVAAAAESSFAATAAVEPYMSAIAAGAAAAALLL